MLPPRNRNDVDKLIQNQVQENLHLDYKASGAIDHSKRAEITKDVSAFANSDGGIIVYGVVEQNNIPVSIDTGIDHRKFSREWLEQVINTNISPRIDGIEIVQIVLSSDRSIYAVSVPTSFRGPHQSADKKYYKRYNFQSVAMEDYEINDIRNRKSSVVPLVNFDAYMKEHNIVFLEVANIGEFPALDVMFSFTPSLSWHDDAHYPKLFSNGCKFLPPGRKHHFFYHTYVDVVNNERIPKSFNVEVSYIHPSISQRITDTFHIDFMDYYNSTVVDSEIKEQTETLKEHLQRLTKEIATLTSHIEQLSNIAGATGLDVSVRTLRNIRHIVNAEQEIEKIDPRYADVNVFREVLGVDIQLAHNLQWFFRQRDKEKSLRDLDGMTENLIENIQRHFLL
jgi:uncharacterized protein (UPF0335 family)